MNIKGKTLAEIGSDLVGTLGQTQKKKKQPSELDLLSPESGSGDATAIDISRTSAIKNSIDAEAMLAERREKVERIKKLVQSGQYQMPSSEELAKSLGEEVIFELMTSTDQLV